MDQNSQLGAIAMGLQGLGAGIQGNLPQFQQMQMQQQEMQQRQAAAQQKAIEDRQKTMFYDADAALRLAEQGNYDAVIGLGMQRLKLLQNFPDADPSDTQRLTQLALAARNGEEEAAELLKGELVGTVELGRSMGLLERPKDSEGYTLGKGDVRFDAAGKEVARNTPQEGFEMLPVEEAQAMGLPANAAYQRDIATGKISQIGASGTTVNINQGAENAYLQGRAGAQAGAMAELEKSAASAYRANTALDRFIASSESGDQGAAQPLLTAAKSFISSFGYTPEGLTDTATMQQAIGDILGAKMAELGARGLTDRDMDILRQSLPRVETDHKSRVEIARILKKANDAVLQEYDAQTQFEEENYPDFRFQRPTWLNDYRSGSRKTSDSDPLGLLK